MPEQKSQIEKFKQSTREHCADDDELHWDEQLKKAAKAKPALENAR